MQWLRPVVSSVIGLALTPVGSAQGAGSTLPAYPIEPFPIVETVPTGATLEGVRVAFGPDGRIHVSYTESTALWYARKDMWSGEWTKEIVYSSSVGGHDLALGRDGEPQLAFNTSPSFGDWGSLYHARRTVGGWTITPVDGAEIYGYGVAISVDSLGKAHILGKQEQDGPLWYFLPTGLGWAGEVLDLDSNPGRYSCIRLDTADTPHVAYSTWSPKTEPRYATREEGGTWSVTTLAQTNTYRQVCLALDASGLPHVTFHDGDDGLYYSRFDGVGWATSKVSELNGKYAGMEVDEYGRYHILVPNDDGWLYYVHRGRAVRVDPGVGAAALALDVYDRPHLVYEKGALEFVLRTR